MKVLVIGGGGRCHALCESLKKSQLVTEVFCAPGNAGMTDVTKVDIKDNEIEKLKDFAMRENISLTIVGPEIPLSMGIVDLFQASNLKIFGPDKKCAEIESSKEYAKDLMKRHNIPTADYATFSTFEEASNYFEKISFPTVIKFDGLAYGKGVVICKTKEEAFSTSKKMLKDKIFGDGKIVVEEFLQGPEFSLMCLVGNGQVIELDIAQDHKREGDGDTGENTGGMGAYSPVPIIPPSDVDYAMKNIMIKTVEAMALEGRNFQGVLYGGLMKTESGIKVIEFNARFGDPETEVVLPRLKTDLVQVILNLLEGKKTEKLEFESLVTVGVVMASKGYPRTYEKGFEILNLENMEGIFHMGTTLENGKIKTNGGRVLLVLGKGETFKLAQKNAYEKISKIKCDNLIFRTDIGYQMINFEENN